MQMCWGNKSDVQLYHRRVGLWVCTITTSREWSLTGWFPMQASLYTNMLWLLTERSCMCGQGNHLSLPSSCYLLAGSWCPPKPSISPHPNHPGVSPHPIQCIQNHESQYTGVLSLDTSQTVTVIFSSHFPPAARQLIGHIRSCTSFPWLKVHVSCVNHEYESNLLPLTSILPSVLWPPCICALEWFEVEAPAHMGYTRPRLHSNCNKYCALFTAVYVAALSDYLKFQVTRSQLIYVGPLTPTCTQIVDVSSRTNTVYGLSCQSNHVCAVLTYTCRSKLSGLWITVNHWL